MNSTDDTDVIITDPKHKAYALQVEKALKAFENSTEWADLIAALVTKRLAQCLHPALPSGVHAKTLETYKMIFDIIGHEKLANDLFLFSIGLFPLLSFSTMAVKSQLLSLYETYFLPLGSNLASSLSGFILALLPGVEEGTESFDRTATLLDDVCSSVHAECFYVNFWESICLSTHLRLNALLYLNNHVIPKHIVPVENIVPLKYINFMVSGICCCLTDENMLVQRNALDLVMLALPLHQSEAVSSAIMLSDKLQILSAALVTLSKRDMSLSRRVFAWMLKCPTTQAVSGKPARVTQVDVADTEYTCSDQVKDLLVNAVFNLLDANMSSGSSSMTFPQLFRILVTFAEKRPVGEELADRVILAYIHFMYSRSLADASAGFKHCDLLFSNFGSAYIWQAMTSGFVSLSDKKSSTSNQFAASVSRIKSVEEWCRIATYILNGISAQSYSASQQRQFPILLHDILGQMAAAFAQLSYDQLCSCCRLCTDIIAIIQKSSLTVVDDQAEQLAVGKLVAESINSLQTLITNVIVYRVYAGSVPACKKTVGDFILHRATPLFDHKEDNAWKFSDKEDTSPFIVLLVSAYNLLLDMHSIPLPSSLSNELGKSMDKKWSSSEEWLNPFSFTPFIYATLAAIASRHSYSLQLVAINGLTDLLALSYQQSGDDGVTSFPKGEPHSDGDDEKAGDSPIAADRTLNIIKPFNNKHLAFLERDTCLFEALTLILWSGIASRRPGCHEQAAELLFVMHQISPRPTLCEDVICRQLVSNDQNVRHEAFKRFARFWHVSRGIDRRRIKRSRTFNRCLLVFLESLGRTNDQVYPIVIGFVEQIIRDNDLHSALDPLFLLLLHPDTARIYIEKLVVVSSDVSLSKSSASQYDSVSEQSDDDVDKRIVAVASENGKVRFMTAPTQMPSGPSNASQDSSPAIVQLKNGRNIVSSKFGAGGKTSLSNIAEKAAPGKDAAVSRSRSDSPESTNVPFSLVTNPFEDAMIEDYFDDDVIEAKSAATSSTSLADQVSIKTDTNVSEVIRRARRLEHGQIIEPQPEQESRSVSSTSVRTAYAEEFADQFVDSMFRQVFFVLSGEDPEPEAEDKLSSMLPAPSPTPTTSLELYKTNLFTCDVPCLSSCLVHPLASHLLVYYETFDTIRVHHAIKVFSNLIMSSPQSLCIAMATTHLSAGEDASAAAASFGDEALGATQSRQLRMLLAKHRCSLLGRNFYSDTTDQLSSAYRNLSYLELILHTLLHYLRSVHPVKENTADSDHLANTEVQIAAAHLLAVIVSNITRLLRLPQPPVAGFAEYIVEVLSNTRLIHILLYCVGISLAMPHLINNAANNTAASSIAMKVAIDALKQRAFVVSADTQMVYHLKMLVLLRCCAELEMALAGCVPKLRTIFEKSPNWLPQRDPQSPKAVAEYVLRFHTERPLVYQPLLLFSVHHVLSSRELADLHPSWLQLTISLLPSLCRSTSDFVTTAVSNICSGMLWLSDAYAGSTAAKETLSLPTDYLLTLLDALSSLSNFTFSSDNSNASALRPIVTREFAMLSPSETIDPDGSASITGDSTFQLFSATKRTFTWSNWFRDKKTRKGLGAVALSETRSAFIHCLPQLLLSTSTLQRSCYRASGQLDIAGFRPAIHLVASPEAVLCHLAELLNPLITHAHSQLILAAARVYTETSSFTIDSISISPSLDAQQQQPMLQTPIINLLLTLKGLSFPSFADEVAPLLKQALEQKQGQVQQATTANNLLSLFYAYMCADSHSLVLLVDGWSSVLTICRDCVSALPPPPISGSVTITSNDLQLWRLGLTAFAVISKYVEIVQPDLDRKRQKEVQDVVQKTSEAVANATGLVLESVTWFGRHYAVNHNRHGPNKIFFELALDALNLLAENTARLLDTVFDSNEKERAVNVISSMMLLMWPFLRDRSEANIMHFTAASKFLANLAGFAYNRRVWKKEAFELISLHESAIFQMPLSAFSDWKVICDALMTFERQTFKDFILKMQSALNNPMGAIFVNQDVEIQKRAAYLKRLAFIVFSSDADQYVRQLPEIQEKISESLRYNDSPAVVTNIFLLLRIILLRFSSDNLTPFWPVLFTELSRILSLLERKTNDLATLQEMIIADNASLPPSVDTVNWLPGFLAASKLLELILLMPRHHLPQFQISRWAFVNNNSTYLASNELDRIKKTQHNSGSLVQRVARQMARMENCKCSKLEQKNGPFLKQISISSPHDLHSFYHFWATRHDFVEEKHLCLNHGPNVTSNHNSETLHSKNSFIAELEAVVVDDFVEMLPRSAPPHSSSAPSVAGSVNLSK